VGAEVDALRDLPDGVAFGQMPDDLHFQFGEGGGRHRIGSPRIGVRSASRHSRDERAGDLGIQHGVAAMDRANRVLEGAELDVLDDVPSRAGREAPQNHRLLRVAGEHHDVDPGRDAEDAPAHLRAIHVRELHVEQEHVGLELAGNP
jgi:hypothetical protein